MSDIVIFCYFIGNQSAINQIKIIKINIRGHLIFSQSAFYHSADRASDTVLKNDLWAGKGINIDFFQLSQII